MENSILKPCSQFSIYNVGIQKILTPITVRKYKLTFIFFRIYNYSMTINKTYKLLQHSRVLKKTNILAPSY